MASERIFAKARILEIAEFLSAHQAVHVSDLAQRYGVSEATIRTDLRKLAQRGLAVRTHGGAILPSKDFADFGKQDYEYASRLEHNRNLKETIGAAAAALIQDNESIFVDDGTTTLQFVRSLDPNLKLTVITNGINICEALRDYEKIDVIGTGGSMSKIDFSFSGKASEQLIREFYVDRAVLGASAVSVFGGFTSPSGGKADLKRAMIERSKQLIVLADHTKLDRTLLYPVCELSSIHTLITDSHAPHEFTDRLVEAGVQVIVARQSESRVLRSES